MRSLPAVNAPRATHRGTNHLSIVCRETRSYIILDSSLCSLYQHWNALMAALDH